MSQGKELKFANRGELEKQIPLQLKKNFFTLKEFHRTP